MREKNSFVPDFSGFYLASDGYSCASSVLSAVHKHWFLTYDREGLAGTDSVGYRSSYLNRIVKLGEGIMERQYTCPAVLLTYSFGLYRKRHSGLLQRHSAILPALRTPRDNQFDSGAYDDPTS